MKDRSTMGFAIAFVFVGAVLGFGIGASWGSFGTTRSFRNDAVKVGVARWVANENGSVKFQWIIPKEIN